ncbi:unnamed protein product [Camellia sinensis]
MARLSSSSSFSFLFFTFCILFIPSCSLGECQRVGKHVALYVFGDSFLDSGNNNYINTTTLDQANFRPYGETFFKFPTGRFSDGRLVSDFIGVDFVTLVLLGGGVAEYAKLPLISPFLEPGVKKKYDDGVNFASAGAGSLSQTFQGQVINLCTQVRYYNKVVGLLRQKLGNEEAKKTLSSAVYLFGVGTNDYISLFLTNSTFLNSFSNSQYVGMVIGNLTMVIKEVYKKGGRKFGFLNLGPLGCLPGIRIIKPEDNGGCLEEASQLANLHNEALSKLLSQLVNQLKGFKYALYDFNSNLRLKMNHPSKYGFKEGKIACCGTGRFRGTFSCGGKRPVKDYELCDNPNEYVFWDSFHLTEKVHKQMADQIWNGNPNVVKPYNLKNLFQCLQ